MSSPPFGATLAVEIVSAARDGRRMFPPPLHCSFLSLLEFFRYLAAPILFPSRNSAFVTDNCHVAPAGDATLNERPRPRQRGPPHQGGLCQLLHSAGEAHTNLSGHQRHFRE